ncbi:MULTISPECIES: hypothetical protein [unclassified Leucobacter]|uniref:hypothetical protein n=1 Tax=unclassified Leucobacter TaxID=2621730 RepID=UPI00165EBA96|nr:MULTISPECIES: hypothetical protein [unclassified Leucobacter]MBC9927406.1 hypothetical protein [Leucobacter sp. cx-169]
MDTPSFVLSISGIAVSAAGVIIALVIAKRQTAESGVQQEVLIEVSDLTRENALVLGELRDRTIAADPSIEEGPDAEPDADLPANAQPLIDELKARGAKLDFERLKWRKKTTKPPTRGNYGWFVHSDADGERWFVHSGRTTSARRAVPMERIEAWEQNTPGVSPTDIRLDYRIGSGKGSHAWYIETYDGRTFKLSKGGAGVSGVTVTQVDTD